MNRALGTLHQAVNCLQMRNATKAAILMYHRIAQPTLDPWGLSVTPQNFADHLDIIRRKAQPVSLQELAEAHREGKTLKRAVVITFDDGYADNLHNAKPLLEQYNIPATIFITTGHLGCQREFWWDELERVLIQPGRLPETLSLNIYGKVKQWQLGSAAHYSQDDYESDRHRKAWEGQPNSRLAFYYSVWNALRLLPLHQRQVLQDEILNWADSGSQTRNDYRSLTTQELLELEKGGLVEIGAHTVTHPSLAAHSLEIQQAEIYSSKHTIEQLLNHPIKSFSYPFGNFNQSSICVVKDSGFERACSTVQLGVWKGSDRFQLPRFEAQNWTKEVFEKKLDQWLS